MFLSKQMCLLIASIQSEAINYLFQVYPDVILPLEALVLTRSDVLGINKMYKFIQTIMGQACETKYKTNDYHQW